MKKMIAVSLAVVFAALLCQVFFCEEAPPPTRRPRGEGALTAEQREQLRPLMERLREISQNDTLRQVTTEAREAEKVKEAQAVVQKAQEALRNAQQKANEVLNAAVLEIAKKKEMKDLLSLLKERDEILQKLPEQFRGRFPGRGFRGFGTGSGRTRRPGGATQ